MSTIPIRRTGVSAGNKEEWKFDLGPRQTLTLFRHAKGLDAAFGVTDAPLSPPAFAAHAYWLTVITGVPESKWVVTSCGFNKDLIGVSMAGLSEAFITLGQFRREVIRAYEHGNRGMRVEWHTQQRISLREILSVLSGEGHVACQGRLTRLESIAKELASELAMTRRERP